jgi:hypothetical protein
LLRQTSHTYLGDFARTYIFGPQAQYVTPANRWLVRLAGALPARCAARIRSQVSQSSTDTMGSTCVYTHSLSGLSFQVFERSLVWV